MYTIEESGIKELEAYIQEIPFKYAQPILRILNAKLVKFEEPTPKEEKPNAKNNTKQ